MTHKANMKRRFESISEGLVKSTQNQTLLNKIYTEVYITEGESERVNNEHEVWQVESASKPQTTEDAAINCNDIFKPLPGQQKCNRTVMTKGIAGIGKTVSVQKFILDWAEERANHDLDFMFVLPFRELNLIRHDQYSLHRLLLDFHPELRELKDGDYKDGHILFIFDGLDESRLPLNFQKNQKLSDVTQLSSVDVLMTSLIQGTLLPSALIWITSRPAAANQIPSQCISQVTEVRGFNDPQKEEYFRRRISDQNQANRIISHIKAARSLHIMCHMPVFCWISATVLQQILEQDDGKEAPKTLTEMYIHFLLIQTIRKSQKYQDESETDRQRLLESHKGVILKLAELAFKHLENGNLMFYEEDLRECGIDVGEASVYSGMCTEIFREESVFHHKKVYCFVHLSIQEFLAALHVFVSHQNKNLDVMKTFLYKCLGSSDEDEDDGDYGEDDRDEDDGDYYYNYHYSYNYDKDNGLYILLKGAVDKALCSPNGHLDLFVRFLVGISVECNQAILQGLLIHTQRSSESIRDTCEYIKMLKREDPSPERHINLLHCLFEMDDHSLHEEVQKYLKYSDGSASELSPAHCSALAHMLLMSEEVLDELDLRKYRTSEEGLRRLMPAVLCCRKAVLADCKLTEKSLEIVASALQSVNGHIEELDLSKNELQKLGEKLLSTLQSPNCKLETLRLAGCKLTEQSCEILASTLQSDKSLIRELDLSHNDLEKSGEKLICALHSPNCKLETLTLAGCKLTEKSCEIVASALQSANSPLRELDLSHNDLQKSGEKLLSALQSPKWNLETVRLAGCKLTEKSFDILISALQFANHSVRELDLSQNDLHKSDGKLVSALQSTKCKLETLRLVGCGLTEKSGDVLAFALQSANSHLRKLDLSKNSLGDCGGKLGSEALNPHSKMRILRLAGCKLTEKPCEVVSSAVQHMESLTELDLSDNHMSITEIQLLIAGICRPNSELQILRLAGCNLKEEACEVVVSALKSLVSLTELDLSKNYLSATDIHLLDVWSQLKRKQPVSRYYHGENGRIKPELRRYACELTLDPNTAYKCHALSNKNKKVKHRRKEQPYPAHPERFDSCCQVLCREGLSGRCYWEAEWSGNADGPEIAVAYKSIQRKGWGIDSGFGCNDKSWSLDCSGNSYSARHNNKKIVIPAPAFHCNRVGVYLDWPAGTLSFYSISSDTLTHLHTFHSTFTEPLHPGFYVWLRSSVSLCQLPST